MQWLRANFISDACCVVRTFDICILIAKMQKQTKKKKNSQNHQNIWQKQFYCAYEYMIMQHGQHLPNGWENW